MVTADPKLRAAAQAFADDITDVIDRTVCDDPPIKAQVQVGRVLIEPLDEDGNQASLPLVVAGIHRLDLIVRWRCIWGSMGRHLAIEDSKFILRLPHLREPLIRVEYQREREYAPAHIQVHAESSALGYLLAFAQTTEDPPKTQVLHLPVGGRRFRPCLEDVLEFAIVDLGVEARDGWQEAISEGRQRWMKVQLKAAIRDAVSADPDSSAQWLTQAVNEAAADIAP